MAFADQTTLRQTVNLPQLHCDCLSGFAAAAERRSLLQKHLVEEAEPERLTRKTLPKDL